ncbi:MAG: glycosyltransferase family 4 protein [Armatimonadota bacterium]|nr:glycosyltransferase family 4 protein [bacterium]
MKIAFFHNLPYGGAMKVLREQVSRLGSDVSAIYTFAGTTNRADDRCPLTRSFTVRQFTCPGYPFGRLYPAIGMLNLKMMEAACKNVAAAIDSEGYDAVIVHPCFTTQTPPVLKYLRTPTLYYCHEPLRWAHEAVLSGTPLVPFTAPATAIYRRMAVKNEYDGLKAANAVLCNSRFTRETIARIYGIFPTVNYVGVNTNVYRPADEKRDHAVIMVGAMAPFKGHDFLIESLSRIKSTDRPILRLVCGRYNLGAKSQLKEKCDAKGVRVEFYEDITDEDLVSLYRTSKATVYATILEPFGLVPIESMACATPVVAVAEGGIRETVTHGVTGYLTDRDPQEFADAVMRIIDNPDLIRKMGAAGVEHVRDNWTWQKSIDGLRSAIDSIIRT